MGEADEAQRNADWLALQRVFIGAQGATRREDAKLQRAEKLASIGTQAVFPAGFYVSGFEGAEDRRGRFVTVAVTDEDFVFLDGEVEPEPMRELGRVPRADVSVEIRPARPDARITPAGFMVECELSLRSGRDSRLVTLAFGSEEGAREVESRLLNRTPARELASGPIVVPARMGRSMDLSGAPPGSSAGEPQPPIREDRRRWWPGRSL